MTKPCDECFILNLNILLINLYYTFSKRKDEFDDIVGYPKMIWEHYQVGDEKESVGKTKTGLKVIEHI